MLFHLTDTPFEDVLLEFPKGLAAYKHYDSDIAGPTRGLGDDSPLAFNQCPAIVHRRATGNGGGAQEVRHGSHTAVGMQHVGKQLGLAPRDGVARAAREKLGWPLGSALSSLLSGLFAVLSWVCPCLVARSGSVEQTCLTRLGYFERLLRLQGARVGVGEPFFFGASPSPADVALFDVVTAVRHLWTLDRVLGTAEKLGARFPRVAALLAKLEERPGIKRRLEAQGGADVVQCIVDKL